MSSDDAETDPEAMDRMLQAMAIWERHLRTAGEEWQEGVEDSAEEYRRGFAESMGVDPEDVPDEAVERWQEGVAETSAEEFSQSLADEGADWLAGLYESETGHEPPEAVMEAAQVVEDEIRQAGDDVSDEELADRMRQAVRQRAGG